MRGARRLAAELHDPPLGGCARTFDVFSRPPCCRMQRQVRHGCIVLPCHLLTALAHPALLCPPPPTCLQPPGSLKLGSSLLCEIIPGGKKESYEDLDEVRPWLGTFCGEAHGRGLVLLKCALARCVGASTGQRRVAMSMRPACLSGRLEHACMPLPLHPHRPHRPPTCLRWRPAWWSRCSRTWLPCSSTASTSRWHGSRQRCAARRGRNWEGGWCGGRLEGREAAAARQACVSGLAEHQASRHHPLPPTNSGGRAPRGATAATAASKACSSVCSALQYTALNMLNTRVAPVTSAAAGGVDCGEAQQAARLCRLLRWARHHGAWR